MDSKQKEIQIDLKKKKRKTLTVQIIEHLVEITSVHHCSVYFFTELFLLSLVTTWPGL